MTTAWRRKRAIDLARIACTLATLTAVGGCGDGDETAGGTTGPGGGEPSACPPGEWPDAGGACAPAGLPAGWEEPSTPLPNAGVTSCATGFVADGMRGCAVILPSSPCAAGLMAVPGDTMCRPVGSCGSGTWGSIPPATSNEYVDASFGGPSDGSITAPWTTIQQAVIAAANGATVAIAAGTYSENVIVSGKSVRLWGRCPSLVEVAPLGGSAAVTIDQASGSELRGVAVTGAMRGVSVAASTGVVFDEVWLHDVGAEALAIDAGSVATIGNALIEGATGFAIWLQASEVTIDSSELRGTFPWSDGTDGRAIQALVDANATRSTVSVSRSVIAGHRYFAVAIRGSDLQMEASVVRANDVEPDSGVGMALHLLDDQGQRSAGEVRQSLLADNVLVAVGTLGSDLVVEDTTIERTTPRLPREYGYGAVSGGGADPTLRGSLVLRSCTIRDNVDGGAIALGSDLTLDRVLVQRTAQGAMSGTQNGRGVLAEVDAEAGAPSVAIVASIIEDNHHAGVLQSGGELSIVDSIVRRTLAQAGGRASVGVAVAFEANASLQGVTVEQNQGYGVLVDSGRMIMDRCAVMNTEPQPLDGQLGHGVHARTVAAAMELGRVELRDSVVAASHERGVVALGGSYDLETTLVRDTQADADGAFGRGIETQPALDGRPSDLAMRWSEVRDSRGTGVFAWSSNVSLEAVRITGTRFELISLGEGYGLVASGGPLRLAPSSVTVVGSLLDGNQMSGVVADASALSLSHTAVVDVLPREADGHYGRCVSGQQGAQLSSEDSLFAGCLEIGVFVLDSTASMSRVQVEGVLADVNDGQMGDAVVVAARDGVAALTLADSALIGSARAGVSAFSASATLSGNRFECNPIDLDLEPPGGGATLVDLGGNDCGCGEARIVCKAQSTGAAVPAPLP